MPEQPGWQKAASPVGMNVLGIQGKTVIRSLFVHPHAWFEDTVSLRNESLVCERAAVCNRERALPSTDTNFPAQFITAMVVSVNKNMPQQHT
ncbi:MAG: hypothetical protein JXL20_05345 [Deltaproteobacteria bacterium]|nr:hypothetical protein [Deltaproteobacteria bacterium]